MDRSSRKKRTSSASALTVIGALALVVASIARADERPLETALVQFREVDLTYAAEAVVEATRQSTVSAQVTGRIIELRYDVGDFVEKGQVIARIDQTEAGQVLAGSRAQVAQAQAAFDNARVELERTRELARQKFVSQAALDKAEAQFRVTAAQLETARAGAGQATTTKGYTTVVAPYSGVVSARHVELGEMAAPGKPLLTGFDPTDLRVVATVPQYKVAAVKAASKALVEIPSTGKWIQAVGITVLPSADAQTHSTRVRLDLPRDVRDVYPGVYARAHFATGRARKLLVPAAAVVRRSEVTGAYTVDEQGRILFRQLRLGDAIGDQGVEVLAGLVAGQKVALDPVQAGMRAARQPAQ